MKAILSYAVAAMLILSAAGCNTTTDPNSDGVQMTVTQLFDTPGYSWMRSEVASYSPNPAVVSEIAAEFQAKSKKYIYMSILPVPAPAQKSVSADHQNASGGRAYRK